MLHLDPITLPVMGSTVITAKANIGDVDATDELASSSSGEKSSSMMERLHDDPVSHDLGCHWQGTLT